MKLPLLGVTPMTDPEKNGWWLRTNYMEPLSAAGGLPVMLPQIRAQAGEMARRFDGFLLTGGPDVLPNYYGEQTRPYGLFLSPARDEFEMALLEEILKQGKPVLAICRGIQVLNAFLGGSLYQHLPLEHPSCVPHYMERPYDRFAHEVFLTPGEPLAELLGREKIGVNSCHHQAIRRLAPPLREMARSTDGLIEGVYLPDASFVWGVQWHPEHTALRDEASRALFSAFVRAAQNG
ncbi:MAG: gamma-glutamyl-gamma-aminobutyrate hydrolase family protein [Oscillospiraceae bacterium]|nr:gamma-glutamyl-gamma-aminobutyrate hydrolase family protein [Oscillospiraceae bacterium]